MTKQEIIQMINTVIAGQGNHVSGDNLAKVLTPLAENYTSEGQSEAPASSVRLITTGLDNYELESITIPGDTPGANKFIAVEGDEGRFNRLVGTWEPGGVNLAEFFEIADIEGMDTLVVKEAAPFYNSPAAFAQYLENITESGKIPYVSAEYSNVIGVGSVKMFGFPFVTDSEAEQSIYIGKQFIRSGRN